MKPAKHYLRLDINEGKLDIKQHEVPAGDVEDAILIDVDTLAAILQNQISLSRPNNSVLFTCHKI
ncbi:hypothetical protein JCM19231_936 [Vibrio ishigakensis]|uniref:Uncharacterized protein n=1 Tax=Vibrio ishigakensis TaxID=1481914 RepID=A0A0B8NJX1_9VIBR|nr:hypothetical protein JCM19231_936 [Vibrio ishigakensis]